MGLAAAIVRAFAQVFINPGWSPPADSLTLNVEAMNLCEISALVGSQPKATKMIPLVREHKYVSLHLESLNNSSVFRMQRLQTPWVVPEDCKSTVANIPSEV